MAVKTVELPYNVLEAARQRIVNIFNNGTKVYLAFSGGKDSIALADIVYRLALEGKINPKQIVMYFVDEEAIYDCIEKIVLQYRAKFLHLGAQFEWWCIEAKHYNCFNNLSNDETFVCWDSTRRNVWVRQPPPFAIRDHALLKKRVDNYQSFLPKVHKDGIDMIGVRCSESLQRLKAYTHRKSWLVDGKAWPLYDWSDNDVWLHILKNNLDFPEAYQYMWASGTKKRQLRISQFFSIDTARSLVSMNEYYPDLMEKITKREPNAYLAALYWDSEMFGRSTRKRKELEKLSGEAPKDYKVLLKEYFKNINKTATNSHQLQSAKSYMKLYLKFYQNIDDKIAKNMYEALQKGDPKGRNFRAIYIALAQKIVDDAREANLKYNEEWDTKWT